jgi:hypothetical protein
LDAVGTVVDPGPTCLDELAGRDHCGVADDGDQVALSASFGAQHAEEFSELWNVTRSTSPAKTSVEVIVLGPPGMAP